MSQRRPPGERSQGHKTTSRDAIEVSKKMERMLHGLAPELQGAVICDLLAIWLAGHAPVLRPGMLKIHLEQLLPLIETNEKMIFGEFGHPARTKGAPQ